jgi:hypothetical protein
MAGCLLCYSSACHLFRQAMSESAIPSLPADTNIGALRYQQRYQHLLWMHTDHHARPQQERLEKPSLFTLQRTAVNVYERENGARGVTTLID